MSPIKRDLHLPPRYLHSIKKCFPFFVFWISRKIPNKKQSLQLLDWNLQGIIGSFRIGWEDRESRLLRKKIVSRWRFEKCSTFRISHGRGIATALYLIALTFSPRSWNNSSKDMSTCFMDSLSVTSSNRIPLSPAIAFRWSILFLRMASGIPCGKASHVGKLFL